MSFFDVFHVSQPTTAQLCEIRSDQQRHDLTYEGIGLTLGEMPTDYHHLRATRVVGTGSAHMERGRAAIRTWKAQAQLKLKLEPLAPQFVEGEVLVFALPMRPSPFWATGACRIVRIVDEPRRFGFVYGTLPHHPEAGEEAFLVHHHEDDTVSFSITAFSRAKALPMRASGPIGRLIQRQAAETYLDGYEQASRN
jgi:uncharacterized protein (UPF0548 family)